MSERNAAVAVYGTHVEAEEAIKELQRAGIDMRSFSVIGKVTHTDEHVVGYCNTGDRMKYWGSVVQYELALKTDNFLRMVHGTAAEVEKARDIITRTRPVTMTLHSADIVGAAAK
jgi:hypothetical protein